MVMHALVAFIKQRLLFWSDRHDPAALR
jgi:hypothetical protein